MMRHTFREEQSGLPLGKLVIGIGLAIVAIGVMVGLYGHFSLERKADALHASAKDQIRQEHTDLALQRINSALSLMEKPEYLETKANILIAQNKLYEADPVLEKLIRLRPNNANYRYLSATTALNEEEWARGEQRLKEALQLEPNNATYAVYLANMLYRENKIDLARQHYEAILHKNPQCQFAWEQYATSHANAGRYTEAIAVMMRALKQRPQDAYLFYLLGCIYDNHGDKAKAVAAYRHSLELEPMPDSIAASRILAITGHPVPPALEN
jgi:Flp pilus assembly protein TadD